MQPTVSVTRPNQPEALAIWRIMHIGYEHVAHVARTQVDVLGFSLPIRPVPMILARSKPEDSLKRH